MWMSPQTPIRLGMIVNQKAFANLKPEQLELFQSIVPQHSFFVSPSIEKTWEGLQLLLCQNQVNVLCVCGGDGTLHSVVNALWNHQKELPYLPYLFLVRGGTLNITASHLDLEGNSSHLLQKFAKKFSILGELPLAYLPLLQVESEVWGTQMGFVFGSCLPSACLELYEKQFGGGINGLWDFLQEIMKGFVFGSAFWKQHSHLLEGPKGMFTFDQTSQEYLAVVASVIDIKLMGGWIKGMVVNRSQPQTFSIKILENKTPGQIVATLPKLVFGNEGEGIQHIDGVKKVSIPHFFSLDGEVYPSEKDDFCEITSPSFSLPFVKNWLN